MHILITNDDGIASEGIHHLADIASQFGKVTVVAPHTEQSAVGQKLTFRRPVELHQHRPRWYSVEGTPTDCVYIGLHHICKDDPPDLLLSGINHGPNLGFDIHYSGTVGAATEGANNGLFSIAFSIATHHPEEEHWKVVKPAVAATLEWFFERQAQLETRLFNVNIPPQPRQPLNFRITRMGEVRRTPHIIEIHGPRGEHLCWISGSDTRYSTHLEHDCQVVQEGDISITPLTLDRSIPLLLKKSDT